MFRRALENAIGKQAERLPLGEMSSYGSSLMAPAGTVNKGAALGKMASAATLFSVINLIAEDVAAVTWKVYQITGNGERTEVEPSMRPRSRTESAGQRLYRLWHSVNPFYTREDFIEATTQHYELTGEEYWLLVRNALGEVVEMWPIRPDRISPVPDREEFIKGYIYKIGGESIALGTEDIIWNRRPHPSNPYAGIGTVQALGVDLGIDRNAAEWVSNFFKNSAEPGGIIEYDRELSERQFNNLASRWEAQHRGAQNAHRVAIIEGGKWQERKYTQRDMEFEKLRRFEREQIMVAFRIHPAMVGISENVNRANAEAAEVIHSRRVILPRLRKRRGVVNERLVKPYFGEDLELDFVDPTPENRVQDLDEATKLYGAGLATRNEARSRMGLDEADEGGDDYKTDAPGPMGLGAPPAERKNGRIWQLTGEWFKAEEAPPLAEEIEAHQRLMETNWAKRLAQEAKALVELLEAADGKGWRQAPVLKQLEMTALDSFDWNWESKFGREVIAELERAFALAFMAEVPLANPGMVSVLAVEFARNRGAEVLKPGYSKDGKFLSITETTKHRVRELTARTIANGEGTQSLARAITRDFSFSAAKASTIARTETAKALGEGGLKAAVSKNRDQKRWLTQGDGEETDECIANQDQGWIPIAEIFTSQVETVPQHPNCRCVVEYRTSAVHEAGLRPRAIVDEVRCPTCNSQVAKHHPEGTPEWCRKCKKEFVAGALVHSAA